MSKLFFKDEESMYEVIKNYLVDNGYQVIIDKPRGFGVKFKALKGWIIDVIAVKKGKNLEVIAVEAKNNLGSSSVLDALSNAVLAIYQKENLKHNFRAW
jgi:transcriptional regulator of aromatic amino acid metabolism